MIQKILQIAQEKKQVIGMGVSLKNKEYISRTIRAAESAVKKNFADILLVGNKKELESFGISPNIEIHNTNHPEKSLIDLLREKKIAGAVRGSLSSSKFLEAIKGQYNLKKIFRIALLETATNFTFFFAPIGIDEGNALAEKVTLIRAGRSLLNFLQIDEAPIGVLSGGRMSDLGRDLQVDKSIAEAEELITILEQQDPQINIQHHEILIEDAIAAQCRLIIAPDGVSGNLIYRTLVHLGKGRSHGAWYYNITPPIIDTSRVGPTFEYESAIAFASALASKSS